MGAGAAALGTGADGWEPRRRRDRIGSRRRILVASWVSGAARRFSLSSLVSVPPAFFLPSLVSVPRRVFLVVLGVRAARVFLVVLGVLLPPGWRSSVRGFFASVEDCWPETLVPSSPCAAEPLEPGSATATAPPAPPISRPAASTQTPAAKRKCDRTTISPPQPKDSSPAVQRLQHCRIVRPSGLRESQAKFARSTVSSKPFLRRLDVQSARSGSANDACAQRRRPGRSQSVNDSQKLGGLAVRPRRQQLCTSTGRFASEDCEATSYIGCPPDKPA